MEDRELSRCVYFNGLQNKNCKEGVSYESVRAPALEANRAWDVPCIHRSDLDNCEQRVFPTPEQVEADDRAVREHLGEFLSAMSSGECPHCHQPMKKKQVGPCVYADPCGHRLYQGQI